MEYKEIKIPVKDIVTSPYGTIGMALSYKFDTATNRGDRGSLGLVRKGSLSWKKSTQQQSLELTNEVSRKGKKDPVLAPTSWLGRVSWWLY